MQGRVLVVDDEKAMVLALKGLLSKEGYHVETAGSGEEALRRIETGSFHVVITDLSMNGVGGMQVLEHARRVDPDLAVVMITAYGAEKIAVQAMKLGAVDYVPKPFDNDELRLVVRRVMDTVLLRRDHRRLLEQVERAFGFEQIVGQSPAMRRLFETIDKIADTDVTVLIRGGSGTGKELVANALHYRSPRRTKPLVKMNCAALSQELVESELIDHFLKEAARRFGRDPKPLTGEALRACVTHEWRGNVRELRSAVEQALLLAPGAEITAADLFGRPVEAAPADAPLPASFREAKDRMVENFERDFLRQALRRHGGNITKAAEEVGMHRQNLQQKMRELGLTADEAVKE